jgi:hypothetical protein
MFRVFASRTVKEGGAMQITVKQATDMDYVILFHWGLPETLIESHYGTIPYLTYLELEYTRITANTGRSGGIVTDSRGMVTLCVNRVAGGETFWRNKRMVDMRKKREAEKILQLI